MSDLFIVWLSLSLSATLIAGLIYLVQKLAATRLTPTWKYYIWLIVLFRLLIPVAPEGSLVGNLFTPLQEQSIEIDSSQQQPSMSAEMEGNESSSTTATALPSQALNSTDDRNASVVDSVTGSASHTPISTASPSSLWSLVWKSLSMIWIIGAVLMFMWKLVGYLRFKHSLTLHNVVVSDELTLASLAHAKEQKRIYNEVPVFHNPLITSPMLVGLQQPSIILPYGHFNEQQLNYIFLHELTHLKRGDLWIKWLAQIALCLHWFNPVIYKLVKELNQACELSCDKAVITGMTRGQKQGYGETLITLAASHKTSARSFVGTMSAEKNNLKDRLTAIMQSEKIRKPRFLWITGLSVVLIISAIYIGAATPVFTIAQSNYDFSRLRVNDVSLGQYAQDINTDFYTPVQMNTTQKYQHQYEELKYQTNAEDRIVAFQTEVYTDGARVPYFKVDQEERLFPFTMKTMADLEGQLGKQKSTWYNRAQKLKSVTYQDSKNQISLTAIYSDNDDRLVWLQVEYTTAQPTRLYSAYNLEVISQYKTPYIGDASKVSKIAGSLNTPDPAYTQNFIQMQTSHEPYGVTVYYEPRQGADLTSLVDPSRPSDPSERLQRQLRKNALILFSMIDNAGEVTFAFRDTPSMEGTIVAKEYQRTVTIQRQSLEAEFGSLQELGNNLDQLDQLLLNWK